MKARFLRFAPAAISIPRRWLAGVKMPSLRSRADGISSLSSAGGLFGLPVSFGTCFPVRLRPARQSPRSRTLLTRVLAVRSSWRIDVRHP